MDRVRRVSTAGSGVPRPRDADPLRRGADAAGRDLPRWFVTAAAISWRMLVLAGGLYVLGVVVERMAAVVVPVAVALLLAALLAPAVDGLTARGLPRGVATAVVLVGGLLGLGALITLVAVAFISGLPALTAQLGASIDAVTGWLVRGPLHLSPVQLDGLRTGLLTSLNANQANVTAQALSTVGTIGQTLTEILLALFTLIFFLYDGAGIWNFLTTAAPAQVRDRVDLAGRRSLAALVSYVRATATVAVVDAVAIGVGLAVLGVPLAVPLSALVFLGAFIPIVGAVVAGGIAVLIALAALGPIQALILLAIVVGVMQLESHVLQPLLLGRAVKLHPLAVVLAIAAGLVAAGIAGALLAVPLLAVLNSGIRSLLSSADKHVPPRSVRPEPEESGPDEPGLDTELDDGTDRRGAETR